MSDERYQAITLRLPKNLHTALKESAAKLEIPMAELAIRGIKMALRPDDPQAAASPNRPCLRDRAKTYILDRGSVGRRDLQRHLGISSQTVDELLVDLRLMEQVTEGRRGQSIKVLCFEPDAPDWLAWAKEHGI